MSVPSEAREPTEGGLLNHRCEFVRENPDNRGEPPANPDWKLFSDNMVNIFNWSPDGSLEAKRGVGSADAESFWPGPEEHEASFAYHLQRWFVDETGAPLDAMYDGLMRDEDGRLPNTHTVVDREAHHSGGSMGAGFYSYTVAQGGKIDTVSNEGEADESLPMEFEVEYVFEKVRPYVINRLPTPSTLQVVSSSEVDNTQQITIENEGAGQTETLALDGATPVTTITEFDSVDAAWLSAQTEGNVTISRTGDTSHVMTIYGKVRHNNIEGDRGVPALGDGSHESEIQPQDNRIYEHFLSSQIERGPTTIINGVEFGPRLSSTSFEVSNNIDTEALAHTRRMSLDEGSREVMVEASIAGPMSSHQTIMSHLTNDGADITWTFLGGSLRFPMAVVTDPGERVSEAEETTSYIDAEFTSRKTADDPAIVIE